MNAERQWLRFVRLALLCALVPGFGLAAWMTGAWMVGLSPGFWYLAAVQTHAVALLMGWGTAMIFGVGLHFLPRLRGVRLFRPEWASVLFWWLALGLALRLGGQLLLATLAPVGQGAPVTWLNRVVAGGVMLQTLGVGGLLALLVVTFRAGRPLKENRGFKQIVPLLVVAALALLLAQLAWCVGAIQGLASGGNLALLPAQAQWTAVELMLFGFVAAMAIAMSGRLFPLTFRTQLPQLRGLLVAAGLLGGGVILTLLEQAPCIRSWSARSVAGAAAGCYAGGLLCGTFAVRIFHSRKAIPNTVVPYRVWDDPAALGVLSAYVWAVLAAGFLLLFALQQAGLPVPARVAQKNLARHAMGAGFMTLLIVSVGWKMLPGFGGGQPRGRGLLWSSVLLGNLTVLLRVIPVLLPEGQRSGRSWSGMLFPFAGLAGLATILAFAVALRVSFDAAKRNRPPPGRSPQAPTPA